MRIVEPTKRWFAMYRPANLDLETAEKYMRIAWIAGLFSIAGNLELLIEDSNTTSVPDMFFLAIFVFGTYKRNVFCAVSLLISKLAGFVWFFPRVLRGMDVAHVAEFVLYGVAFANCYYLGAVGAIRYQQLIRSRRREPVETSVMSFLVAFGSVTMSLFNSGISA
jgi:hypothetical protein